MRTIFGALFLVLCLSPLAHADVVILKNGDKLTGSLVDAQKTDITLRSDALGQLKIPLSQVQSVSGGGSFVVVTRERQTLEGQIEFTADGNWHVIHDGTPETIEADKLNVVMPATPYRTALEGANKPWRLWNGSVNVGYNIQNGDQQSNTFSTFVNAVRQLPDKLLLTQNSWRTNYNLVTLFSNSSKDGVSVSSNTISSSLRQDYLFSPRNFIFVFSQVDHIESQGLSLRQTVGPGFGRDLVRNNRAVLSTLESVSYEHHKLTSGLSDRSTEARIGESLEFRLMSRVRLNHTLNYYQNVANIGRQHADARADLSFQVNRYLGLNAGIVDLYLSEPDAGRRPNNFIFTTGFGFKFQ